MLLRDKFVKKIGDISRPIVVSCILTNKLINTLVLLHACMQCCLRTFMFMRAYFRLCVGACAP